ncbi:MAG: hypothetical protein JXR37_37915 [Kiritimatiellae bacterium]|nr:hypothetical protein [Kiritimatiellia bacterium]
MRHPHTVPAVSCASRCALALGLLGLLAGCTATHRGRDFGHWGLPGESIHMIRFVQAGSQHPLSGGELVAILPFLGDVPEPNMGELNRLLAKEARNYLPVRIVAVRAGGELKDFVTKANLMPVVGVFDVHEISRLGKLLGVTHVLAGHVEHFRLYPPQALTLTFALIETASHEIVAEMDATFDASEQCVLTAADRYLQSRHARKYNTESLDTLLASPAQYAAFVCTQCMRALRKEAWRAKKAS